MHNFTTRFSTLALEELQCGWTQLHFKTERISSSNNQHHHHIQQPQYASELLKWYSLVWVLLFELKTVNQQLKSNCPCLIMPQTMPSTRDPSSDGPMVQTSTTACKPGSLPIRGFFSSIGKYMLTIFYVHR